MCVLQSAAPDSIATGGKSAFLILTPAFLVAYMTLANCCSDTKKRPRTCAFIMLGRLRDAVADVRDAGSNATRWLGIDELAQAAAYAGSGNERWRVVGARKAVAEEPELECNAAAVECSISAAVRGHAALQALEQFAAARQASHARGEWSSAAAPLADAATARPRRWPLTPEEDRRLDETSAAVWKSTSARWRGVPEI